MERITGFWNAQLNNLRNFQILKITQWCNKNGTQCYGLTLTPIKSDSFLGKKLKGAEFPAKQIQTKKSRRYTLRSP